MNMLSIQPATHGGFLVKRIGGLQSVWEVLFAGTLTDCLNFISQQLTETK